MAETVEHEYKQLGLVFHTEAEEVEEDWYRWSVEVDGDVVSLDQVSEVVYILHPTFADRIRHTTSRDQKFRLESEGWGEFNILIRISFVDGRERGAVIPLEF